LVFVLYEIYAWEPAIATITIAPPTSVWYAYGIFAKKMILFTKLRIRAPTSAN